MTDEEPPGISLANTKTGNNGSTTTYPVALRFSVEYVGIGFKFSVVLCWKGVKMSTDRQKQGRGQSEISLYPVPEVAEAKLVLHSGMLCAVEYKNGAVRRCISTAYP